MRANPSVIPSSVHTHTSNWYKTCPGFDFFENSSLASSGSPASSLLLLLPQFYESPFLRSALNKLFSAIMANTIQSVARSLFNLISRVLISPIHPLVAAWLTIVTPFPTAKTPIFIKFVIPRQDQRHYLCWKEPRPSTACLISGELAEEPGGWLYTHQIHAHVFALSPPSCHERFVISHSSLAP